MGRPAFAPRPEFRGYAPAARTEGREPAGPPLCSTGPRLPDQRTCPPDQAVRKDNGPGQPRPLGFGHSQAPVVNRPLGARSRAAMLDLLGPQACSLPHPKTLPPR